MRLLVGRLLIRLLVRWGFNFDFSRGIANYRTTDFRACNLRRR